MGTSPWDIANIMQGQQFGPDDLLMPQGDPDRDPAAVPVPPKFRPSPLAMQPNFMPGGQPQPPRSLAGGPVARRLASQSPVSLEQLQRIQGEQEGGVSQLAEYAQRYKDLMAKKGGDLSPLLRLIDTAAGSNTAEGYQSPQAKEGEKLAHQMAMQKMVNDARTPIATELLKQYNNENSSSAKLERALASQVGAGDKLAKEQRQVADSLDKQILMTGRDVSAGARDAQGTLVGVNKAVQLIKSVENGKFDPAQMSELTASVARAVTGQNVVTDEMRRSLQNNNLPLTMAGVFQWFSAEPHGVEQQAWVDRYLKTLKTEHTGALNILKQFHDTSINLKSTRLPKDLLEGKRQMAEAYREQTYPDPMLAAGKAVRIYDPKADKVYDVPPDEVEGFKKKRGIK